MAPAADAKVVFRGNILVTFLARVGVPGRQVQKVANQVCGVRACVAGRACARARRRGGGTRNLMNGSRGSAQPRALYVKSTPATRGPSRVGPSAEKHHVSETSFNNFPSGLRTIFST